MQAFSTQLVDCFIRNVRQISQTYTRVRDACSRPDRVYCLKKLSSKPRDNIFILLRCIELQREIRESLHRKPSSGSSVEDISKISELGSF